MQPVVQVLLATFNGDRFLDEQLSSIENQSDVRWQLTASDDMSTDRTEQILKAFAQKRPGVVNLLGRQRAGSARANFFRLLREAPASDYYAFCDQDDVWAPHKLETLLTRCVESEERSTRGCPVLVYSDVSVVDSQLVEIAPSFMREINAAPSHISFGSALVENSIPGCAMLFNHALRTLFLEYEGDLSGARMHDWWLALLALATGEVSFVQEPLVLYRQHSSNAAGSVHRQGLRFAVRKLMQPSGMETAETVSQAQLLIRAHGTHLPAAPRRQAATVANFGSMTKYERVSACINLGILKQGTARQIYQLLKI